MASTRDVLQRIGNNLEESMGVRERETRPALSPVPSARDVGRRPIRNVGRVAIDKVVPDPDQPRVEFDDGALERLAQSIREKGQLTPIRVRWSGELDTWVIISGERRWRATRKAGLSEIDCVFQEAELTKSETLEQQLIENLLREDLQPLEEAKAYAQLIEINRWTGKELATALRIDPSKVTRALALLKLPADIQQQVEEGAVSSRAAYEISRIPDDETRRKLANEAAQGAITHEDAARVVRQRAGKSKPGDRGTRETFQIEGGWRVTVTGRRSAAHEEVEGVLAAALCEARQRFSHVKSEK